MSAEEFAKVSEFAAEANCTVPWYLVLAAIDPVPARPPTEAAAGKSAAGPWLPWAQRREIVASLNSAVRALDTMRLHEVAKIGSNLNQIAHAAHISGTAGEELWEVLGELREVAQELQERAEHLEELAQRAARR
ncbi:hypothetical protein Ntsu_81560 [Nocardia sp. IFM 10818]